MIEDYFLPSPADCVGFSPMQSNTGKEVAILLDSQQTAALNKLRSFELMDRTLALKASDQVGTPLNK